MQKDTLGCISYCSPPEDVQMRQLVVIKTSIALNENMIEFPTTQITC